jgi:hypothetical protein
MCRDQRFPLGAKSGRASKEQRSAMEVSSGMRDLSPTVQSSPVDEITVS